MGAAILVLIFVVDVIMIIYGFIAENTLLITDPGKHQATVLKFIGVMLIVFPLSVVAGLSSGTGRPYGGRGGKEFAGY